MASPTELVVELKDLAKYLAARNAMPGDPVLKSTVQSNMVAAFGNKLEIAKHFNLSR